MKIIHNGSQASSPPTDSPVEWPLAWRLAIRQCFGSSDSMSFDSDEFLNVPVPAERSIGWGKIAVTNVLFSICLPTLITGLDLAIAAPRRNFLSGSSPAA